MSRIAPALAAAALLTATLAGCSTTASDSAPAAKPHGTTSASAAAAPELATASSPLGTIVVDGKGMTVYVFDKDAEGAATSACTGPCVGLWPAVETDSTSPEVKGVTGRIATIAAADGRKQVTLDGLPLYYYAKDSAEGDTSGQGVGGVWWVVGPDGAKIGG